MHYNLYSWEEKTREQKTKSIGGRPSSTSIHRRLYCIAKVEGAFVFSTWFIFSNKKYLEKKYNKIPLKYHLQTITCVIITEGRSCQTCESSPMRLLRCLKWVDAPDQSRLLIMAFVVIMLTALTQCNQYQPLYILYTPLSSVIDAITAIKRF